MGGAGKLNSPQFRIPSHCANFRIESGQGILLRRATDWMREQRLKGEQEGLTLQALEREYRSLGLS
jgi:hypothetical protein